MATIDDQIEVLGLQWTRLFGEPMPFGFEVREEQLPILQQCIDQQSKRPLDIYIESIKGRQY